MIVGQQRAQARSLDDNAALLMLCRAGDQQAWNNVVRRYERLVFAIALREGLSQDQAADATQETFATLLTNLDRIANPSRLGAWLSTVVRRQTWRIRAGSHATVPLSEDQTTTPDAADDLATALWVHEAIEQLEPSCRDLIFALFFDPEEPSYGEIALQIGRPIGSIGPLRIRCLKRLRRVLEEAA